MKGSSRMATTLVCALLTVCAMTAGAEDKRRGSHGATEAMAYVTHGINVWNDQTLVDYSEASPLVPWLAAMPPIKEIGALDSAPGADDAEVITADTDPDLLVATIRSFSEFFNPAGAYDPSLFNRSLDEIGANPFGFGDLTERVQPVSFNEARAGDVYWSPGAAPRPTVAEWNAGSGLVRYRCRPDGSAKVEIAVRDAIPNAVYTLWDVGALAPLTEAEAGYATPLGGLPNVLLTDADGCAYKKVQTPYCPRRPCAAGADSCSSYLSAVLHWDQQVYGASPAATFAGMPVGVVAANHLVWPMSGTALQEPQNPFRGRSLRCRR